MSARTDESTDQFTLVLDEKHSHDRYTFALRLKGSHQRPHRKLTEIQQALHRTGYPTLGLESGFFDHHTKHCLFIKMNQRIKDDTYPDTLEDELFALLKPFVADAIARVDHDLTVITPTDVVTSLPRPTPAKSRKTLRPRKNHALIARTRERRVREQLKRNRLAFQAALVDAGLPPVVLG